MTICQVFVRYTSTGHCWPRASTCLPLQLAIKAVAPVLTVRDGIEPTLTLRGDGAGSSN